METKFTKGDWNILPLENDKEYARIRGTVLGGRYKIADVHDMKSNHELDAEWCQLEREESIANAHLIACAPDMYEMIRSLSNELYQAIDEINDQRSIQVTQQTESQPDLWGMESLYDAEVLLAKARGEK